MKAVQLMAHGDPGRLEVNDIPAPVPGSGEVLIEVRACGLNHLDLWVERGQLPISVRLPRILGGEIAGRVIQLGGDVVGWRVGDRVAVQSNLYCGECEPCLRHEENLCLKGRLVGVDCDGGLAERVVIPATGLVPLPARVDYETSAGLTLAGSTAMHMLTQRVTFRPDDWVLVVGGASGVGSAAIQIARELGGRVIATGSSQAKRELATRLGAEAVVDVSDSHWPSTVRRITGKRGVDIVVEHVGGEVLEKVFHCLARGGTVVTCGATAGKQVGLDLWPFFVKQHRLIGSYGRTRSDLVTTLDWAAAGRLRPVIHRIYPLAEAPEGLNLLRQRQALGKVVINP